jgi:hypothetical protein
VEVVTPGGAPAAPPSWKASCTRLDQEPAGAEPFQPVRARRRLAGCVRPPPTDWVMIRRVLDERAR